MAEFIGTDLLQKLKNPLKFQYRPGSTENLVVETSGYDATHEEVIAAFKLYVREEARDYEKEFPSQLLDEK